jgi:hypothetical protein
MTSRPLVFALVTLLGVVVPACTGFVALGGPPDESTAGDSGSTAPIEAGDATTGAEAGSEAGAAEAGAGGDAGGEGGPGDAGAGDATGAGCGDGDVQIYAITSGTDDAGQATSTPELRTYGTSTFLFTDVGPFLCEPPDALAVSLSSVAIDRAGRRWISDTTGQILTLPATGGSCTPTAYVPGQKGFHGAPLLAFVGGGSSPDTLYAFDRGDAGHPSRGLGSIDTTTLAMTYIGGCTGTWAGVSPVAMTGTGDGRLYVMFPTNSASLVQIDLQSGACGQESPVPGLNGSTVNAMVFWGGEFWIFSNPAPWPMTSVERYLLDAGSAPQVGPMQGFATSAVGASTCAPTH